MKINPLVWSLALVSISFAKMADSDLPPLSVSVYGGDPIKRIVRDEPNSVKANYSLYDTFYGSMAMAMAMGAMEAIGKTDSEAHSVNFNYRLSNETYPSQYDIKLTTNVHAGIKTFEGEVTIDIVIAAPTRHIVLHARQIKILKVTIFNPSTGESEKLSSEYELEREFLTLNRQINKQFDADSEWKLSIVYTGELRDDNNGFFLSQYTDNAGHIHYLGATRFEYIYARAVFPCYDEPDKLATFRITINHSPTYTAISNMPVDEALSSPGKTVFLPTAVIPTHVVAFVVSDFVYTEKVVNGLTQRVYSRASARNKHEYAHEVGTTIVGYLSKYLGVKFIFPQMKHVALPSFSPGAGNNLGLALYSERNLLCDIHIPAVFTQATIAETVAHEISHQWFGNFVPIQSWSNAWLQEGFATLLSYKALHSAEDCECVGTWQNFHIDEYRSALYSDSKDSAKPLSYFVQTTEEIEDLHNSVPYGKAASVLHMWNNAVTDTVFQKGLQNFLKKYQYSDVNEEQFYSAFQTAIEETKYRVPVRFNEMMSTWTHQGGYPILNVTRNYEDGTFTIKQKAFYTDGPLDVNKTWYVPLNYAVASNHDFRNTAATHYLLNVSEKKIDDVKINRRDWLILNKQSTGFYRINYDRANWKLIADGLIKSPNQIHILNRAQLLDDAYSLTLSHRLDHAILLKLLSYLKNEEKYAPWLIASEIFRYFLKMLEGKKNYYDFKLFVGEQVIPIYRKLGVYDVPWEPYFDKYTRNVVINLACSVGLKECLQDTNNKIKALVRRGIPVEPDLVGTVYCQGLRQSGDEEFNFFYNTLMNSKNEEMRSALIYYLSCSENENHIKKYIYSSIDESNRLRIDERSTLLRWIYRRGDMGFLACIEFLNENWNVYANLTSSNGGFNPLDDDIRGMASYVVSQIQEQDLLALLYKVKDSPYVTASLETDVKKRIAMNTQWLQDHGTPIMSWIARYHAGNDNAGSVSP